MINVFDSSICVLTTSGSNWRIAALLQRTSLSLACILLMSCSDQRPHRARTDTIASIETSDSIPTEIGRLLSKATGLQVRSVSVMRGRVDVAILVEEVSGDPDSEYHGFRAIANRLWADTTAASRAETIAVTALRIPKPSGVLERNTYFYYRSERSDVDRR